MNENQIRNKEEQLRKLHLKIDNATNTILTHTIRHNDLIDEAELLEDEIETLTSRRKVSVSDHAIVRYLERYLELDIQGMKDTILTKDFVLKVKAMGDGKYDLPDGMQCVVRSGVVLTIYKK